jgi:hypothetical protein
MSKGVRIKNESMGGLFSFPKKQIIKENCTIKKEKRWLPLMLN